MRSIDPTRTARAHARRDRALAALGWRVLRIDEQLVFDDLDAVVALIIAGARG